MTSRFDMALDLIEQGNYGAAIGECRRVTASRDADDLADKVQATFVQAIAMRMDGQYAEARNLLVQAGKLAGDNMVSQAYIQRELGIICLELAEAANKPKLRSSLLGEALSLFTASRDSFKLYRRPLQANISHSYMGRVWLVGGKPATAMHTLRVVHDSLQIRRPKPMAWLISLDAGNARSARRTDQLIKQYDIFEIDNLVWLARASVKCRFLYLPKVIYLSYRRRIHSGDLSMLTSERFLGWTGMLEDYLIVLIGGDRLYRFIQKMHQM